MVDLLSNFDAIVQQGRARGVVYNPEDGGPVPVYMLLYDEVNKVFKQGDGIHTFAELPTYLDVGAVQEISEYYSAMFAALTLSMSGSFLSINAQGSAFTVTNETLQEIVTKTYFNTTKNNYANVTHTHTVNQVSNFGTAVNYNIGSAPSTIPIIGEDGYLDSELFGTNVILSPFDSDVISYLLLARSASSTVDMLHLDYSIVDEFISQSGVSAEYSVGAVYNNEHYELNSPISDENWGQLQDGPNARYYHAMCSVGNKIYMYGGVRSDGVYLNDLYSYDPLGDTWVQLADGPGVRFFHTMTAIDDKLYIFGGAPYIGEYYNELHVYDISNNTWSQIVAAGPSKRYGHGSAAIGDDLYIYGGYSGTYHNTLWKFNTVSNTWTQIGEGPYGTYGHFFVAIRDTLYLGGGYNGASVSELLYKYTDGSWSSLANLPISIRGASAMTYDNEIYVFGGYNGSVNYLDTMYKYTVSSNIWRALSSCSTGIKQHTIAGVAGHIVSYGGRIANGDYTANVYLYGANPTKLIRSNSYPSGIEPTDARLFVRAEIGDGATLNVDVIASVSRTGGEYWRDVKLEPLPMINSSIKCYAGDADFRYVSQTMTKNWTEATLENHKGGVGLFIVDTANTSGHFNVAKSASTEPGCIIETASGSVTITDITGDGTSNNSVKFFGILVAQSHAVLSIDGLLVDDDELTLNTTYNTVEEWDDSVSYSHPAVADHSATNNGNKIYMLGGIVDGSAVTNILSVYDTDTLKWTRLTAYPGGTICKHTAVFINNKMYVLGGQDKVPGASSITYYNSLYEYTPATDTWVQKTGIGFSIWDHVALAYDGKMYVTGGYRDTMYTMHLPLRSYDPSTDGWAQVISSVGIGAGSTGFVYDNILWFFGGGGSSSEGLGDNKIYKYDPATTLVTTNPTIPTAPSQSIDHSCVIYDGSLYIYGGCNSRTIGQSVNRTMKYSIINNTWTNTTDAFTSPFARRGHSSTLVNGRMYVFGGYDGISSAYTEYVFAEANPKNGQLSADMLVYDCTVSEYGWCPPAKGPGFLRYHDMVGYDGKLYIFGGEHNSALAVGTDKLYSYDPPTDEWILVSTAPVGRRHHTLDVVSDKLYVIGGELDSSTRTGAVYEYNLLTDTWTQKTSMPDDEFCTEHSSVVIANKIYIYGGKDGNGDPTNKLYEYNPSTDSWTTKSDGLAVRLGHSAVAIGTKMYVYGGGTTSNTSSTNLYIYDQITNTWSSGSVGPISIRNHASVSYDNKVYIYGHLYDSDVINTLYIYDADTNIWSLKTNLGLLSVQYHEMQVLNNKIYIYGGISDNLYTRFPINHNELIVYDPIQNLFGRKRAPQNREQSSSVSINGKIYIFGGYNSKNSTGLKDLWAYDTNDEWWYRCSDYSNNRYGHSGVAIDDKLYFIGGASTTDNAIYNTTTNTWSLGNALPQARYLPTITAVGSDIFVYGGTTNATNTMYKYDTIANSWTQRTSGTTTVYAASSACIDNNIYIAGGVTTNPVYNAGQGSASYPSGLPPYVAGTPGTAAVGLPSYPSGLPPYVAGTPATPATYVFNLISAVQTGGGSFNTNVERQAYITSYNQANPWVSFTPTNAGTYLVNTQAAQGPDTPTSFGWIVTTWTYASAIGTPASPGTAAVGDPSYPSGLPPYVAGTPGTAAVGDPSYPSGLPVYIAPSTTYVFSGYSNALTCYNTFSDTWTTKANIPTIGSSTGRGYSTLVAYDKYLYLHGGITSVNTGIRTSLQRYNSTTDVWTTLDAGIIEKGHHNAAVSNGKIIYFGGKDSYGGTTQNIEVFDIISLVSLAKNQTAIVSVNDYPWVDILSIFTRYTEYDSVFRFALGYDDNTFVTYTNSAYRIIVKYTLGTWKYLNVGTDTYINAPINTSHSAISKYYEINSSELDITPVSLSTIPTIRDTKILTSISVTMTGVGSNAPSISTCSISGVINLGEDTPSGTDIMWKIESKCLDDVDIHGLRLQYK